MSSMKKSPEVQFMLLCALMTGCTTCLKTERYAFHVTDLDNRHITENNMTDIFIVTGNIECCLICSQKNGLSYFFHKTSHQCEIYDVIYDIYSNISHSYGWKYYVYRDVPVYSITTALMLTTTLSQQLGTATTQLLTTPYTTTLGSVGTAPYTSTPGSSGSHTTPVNMITAHPTGTNTPATNSTVTSTLPPNANNNLTVTDGSDEDQG